MSPRVNIELNEKLSKYIDILVETGCYGADRQEACERIIAMHVEGMMMSSVSTPAAEAIYMAMSSELGNPEEEPEP